MVRPRQLALILALAVCAAPAVAGEHHIIPLCKGGADAVWNMQWQTIQDAKAKDKWECKP